jgi:hypothetical protein
MSPQVTWEDAMRISTLPLGLAALVLVTFPAYAQLYKSVLPDGRVVYGDDPDPNARRVGTVKVPSKIGTVAPPGRMTITQAPALSGASVSVIGGNGANGSSRPRISTKYCP